MVSSVKVVLLHGTGGSPESNWLPWLARELRSSGIHVSVPKLPTPEGQTLDNWRSAFAKQVGPLEPEMILVGHSMGAGLILRLLEKSGTSVRASFLVSAWEGLLGLADFDPLIESFYREPFDYAAIRKRMGDCRFYHGDDDPYVPLRMGTELAANLGARIEIIAGGKHLNAAAGYHEFRKLLDDILESGILENGAR